MTRRAVSEGNVGRYSQTIAGSFSIERVPEQISDGATASFRAVLFQHLVGAGEQACSDGKA
jgi:hypothetical protein